MKTVSVIGVGYVGLTMATVLVNCGYKVMAVEKNRTKMAALKKGESGFYDPGIDRFFKLALQSGRLVFSDLKEAISQSEMAFICVGTPLKNNGELDKSEIMNVIDEVAKYAPNNFVLVQKSTVPVGTGEAIMKKFPNLKYVANPEFLREGSAIFDTLFFDRVVVGGKSQSAKKKVIGVYRKIHSYGSKIKMKEVEEYAFLYTQKKELPAFNKRVFDTDVPSAEMIKIVANSFLATKISFANMCSELCDSVGADSKTVLDAVGADSRIGRDFLYPGLGFGGGCLPKDLSALIKLGKKNGHNSSLLEGVKKINERRPTVMLDKIESSIGSVRGKKIALLGMSFKAGTSDTRMSPAVSLLGLLKRKGAKVNVYDPHADYKNGVALSKVFDGVDLIIIASEWKEFSKIDFSKIGKKVRQKNIFDARGLLNKRKPEQAGFKVFGV